MTKSRAQQIWIIGVLLALTCLSGLVWFYVAAGSFSVCIPKSPQDAQVKTVTALDAIVELGLKLSTALVGVGAALLLGWKGGIKLTLGIKVIVLVAMLLFIQSALYAVWWRLGMAELWFNNCLEIVNASYLGRRYQAHFYFFIAGLVSLGGLVIGTLFSEHSKGDNT
jgi:hypothetical protein